MFAKSLKHELKAASRVLVPLLVCVLVLGLVLGLSLSGIASLGRWAEQNAGSENVGGELGDPSEDMIEDTENGVDTGEIVGSVVAGIFIILMVGFVIMMIVCAIAVFVLMVRRFYTSFFTDEGYLTFTLPVSVDCHLLTKTVSMIIWSVISYVTIAVALGAFVIGMYQISPESFAMDEYEKLYYQALMLNIRTTFSGTIVFGIINAILSGIAGYFLLFLSISVGCMLTKKHRFIVCVASYLIISGVVTELINLGISVASLPFARISASDGTADLYGMTVMLVSTLFYIAEGVGCYFGTRWILKNKINLD